MHFPRVALLLGAVCLLRLASFGQAAEPSAWDIPTDRNQLHVFILMGQSNMSGCGELLDGDDKPVPGVVRIPTASGPELSWDKAAQPLHRTGGDRFSLGLPFAEEYRRLNPGVMVALIPLGAGGAPIDAINKGTPIYQLAVERARWAAKQGVLKGVLWHQGESDTVEEPLAQKYAASLDQLVKDLRTDLNDEDLPFVCGNLAEFYSTGPDHSAPDRVKRIDRVKQALRELPTRVPHTAFVESTDLKSLDQHMVHFDRASLIEFGKRYAAAMTTLVAGEGDKSAAGKTLPKLSLNAEQLPKEDRTDLDADWLIHDIDRKATVAQGATPDEVVMTNGLIRRVWRIAPNVGMVGFDNLMNGEALVRAVRPEVLLEINGIKCPVGGLNGQPDHAYVLPEWLDKFSRDPHSFQFCGFEVGQTVERFPWKRVRRATSTAWPAPGVSLTFHFRPSAEQLTQPGGDALKDLRVAVHYEMYDGIPLVCKWFSIVNGSEKESVRLNRFTSEIMAAVEYESVADARERWEYPNIHVEAEYEFRGMDPATANRAVHWVTDPQFHTQVNAASQTPCLLEVRPPLGPDVDILPGGRFESFRTFELVHDTTDRERRGLAVRRMYRTVAPWCTENPIIMHVLSSQPEAVRLAVDQSADVGFEMVIMTFGSGLDLENEDPAYLARVKSMVDYARSKGVELGGYSLLASRSVGPKDDVLSPPEGPYRFPNFSYSPCLGSVWGKDYMRKLHTFYEKTGLNLLEHDGSYPGDVCASHDHPGHHGMDDSQWTQWKQITDYYRWCRGQGIYLNVPDFYYLNGSNKCGMGYRESNWGLPRAQQIIHARQNIYDGTWEKTPSMGWMFVPLTNYTGGGAAAVIEPLHEHLDDYSAIMANLFGCGVQACYRGPRLYDTEETRAVVKQHVDRFKQHRDILESDLIHLRRADGRDLDGMLHVNPKLPTCGLAVLFNPTKEPIRRELKLPLYYTGLSGKARIDNGKEVKDYPLDGKGNARVPIEVPAGGHLWVKVEAAK